MGAESLGKLLIITGIFLIVLGVLIFFAPRIPLIGRLPGDILIRRGDFTIYFPIASSIILSIILTIVVNLILDRK